MTDSKRAEGAKPWPTVFLGHGSPLNAIQDTPYSRAWRSLGDKLGKPRAVLCVSAHWMSEGTQLTVNARPRTIHDFGGFPDDLYRVQYPAPGDPALALRTADLLGLGEKALTEEWGLDHGAWGVLLHLYPKADVPVVQLSLDAKKTAAEHAALAKRLAPLRREGVLVLTSGNIVHNLGRLNLADEAPVPLWAREFDHAAARAVAENRPGDLVAWETLTPEARLAHPTPDHYWPLLYTLALREEGESAAFPVEGFQHGTISMRALLVRGSQISDIMFSRDKDTRSALPGDPGVFRPGL